MGSAADLSGELMKLSAFLVEWEENILYPFDAIVSLSEPLRLVLSSLSL